MKSTKPYRKIKQALKYHDFYTFANRCLVHRRSKKNHLQVNFRIFCDMFELYVFGSAFIIFQNIGKIFTYQGSPNYLYDDLKHLHLISKFGKRSTLVDIMMNPFGGDPCYPVILNKCKISKRGVRCLKLWHVKAKFDHIYEQLLKTNKHLHIALSRSVESRSLNDIAIPDGGLARSYVKRINNQLLKIWRNSDVNSQDLIKNVRSKDLLAVIEDLKQIVAHSSMLDTQLLIRRLSPVTNKSYVDSNFDITYNIRSGYKINPQFGFDEMPFLAYPYWMYDYYY